MAESQGKGKTAVLLIVVGVIFLVAFLIGIIAASARYSKWSCGENGYGVVFDAGSSHSSMAVYKWPGDTANGTGVVSQVAFYNECGEEGISSYADDTSKLKPGLEKCLTSALDVVPENSVKSSPVYLAATAGMRMLYETDPDKSDAVFETVRETLRDSEFAFDDEMKQASILSGEREGFSSWISANYLAKHLGVTPAITDVIAETLWGTPIPPLPSFGTLDLGGASTQITFAPEDPSSVPKENKVSLRLYGRNYELYTHSFLCYGVHEARRRMEANLVKASNYSQAPIESPCAPSGYTHTVDGAYLWKAPCSTGPQALAGWGSEVTPAPGATDDAMDSMEYEMVGTGNGAECYEAALALFDFNAPCPNPPCSFNGVHSPKPHGSFKALSAFTYAISALGLSPTAGEEEILTACDEFCNKTIEEMETFPGKMKHKLTFCFHLAYVEALLFDAYKFDDSNYDLEFSNEINGIKLGWALGFMIEETNRIPFEASCLGLSPGAFGGLFVLFLIFLVVGIVLIVIGGRRRMLITKEQGAPI